MNGIDYRQAPNRIAFILSGVEAFPSEFETDQTVNWMGERMARIKHTTIRAGLTKQLITSSPAACASKTPSLEISAGQFKPVAKSTRGSSLATKEWQEYFESPVPEDSLLAKYRALGLLGKSQKFVELLQSIEAAARCDVRIYLKGETGTGKELIARAIHKLSHRSEQKFLAIDCGAIPENLIESELFGHTKGAFTGANRERKGLFEEAHGGTLFMDEIGNLPMNMQAKLMRVLQEGEIRPIGSNVSRKIDVRIISATSSALNDLVQQGVFREDLFYRLHVYPIYVPPLNERQDDIALIGNFFLKKFAKEQQKKAEAFHESILRYMKKRPWPGNVRELENFVERMLTMASPSAIEITRELIPADLASDFEEFTSTDTSPEWKHSLADKLQAYEEQVIRKALEECDWNKSRAARLLKISETNIRFRMQKLNITKPD